VERQHRAEPWSAGEAAAEAGRQSTRRGGGALASPRVARERTGMMFPDPRGGDESPRGKREDRVAEPPGVGFQTSGKFSPG